MKEQKIAIVGQFFETTVEKHKKYAEGNGAIIAHRHSQDTWLDEDGNVCQRLRIRHSYEKEQKKMFTFETYHEDGDAYLEVDVVVWERDENDMLAKTKVGAIVDIDLEKGVSMTSIMFQLSKDFKEQQKNNA